MKKLALLITILLAPVFMTGCKGLSKVNVGGLAVSLNPDEGKPQTISNEVLQSFVNEVVAELQVQFASYDFKSKSLREFVSGSHVIKLTYKKEVHCLYYFYDRKVGSEGNILSVGSKAEFKAEVLEVETCNSGLEVSDLDLDRIEKRVKDFPDRLKEPKSIFKFFTKHSLRILNAYVAVKTGVTL